LFYRTIPVVEDSTVIRSMQKIWPNLPMLVLKDWSQLPKLKLTEAFYHTLWGNFDEYLLNARYLFNWMNAQL
jgi:hypothetical protein